jgi:transcriptional regulator with XRE-family HTH domain
MLADVKIDGQKVRTARERAFLSKRELAERAGLDRSTIGRIEEGVSEVYPRTIRKIAEALSVDPASLVPEESPCLAPTATAPSRSVSRSTSV